MFQLYEYNDADDEADISKLSDKTEWNITDFSQKDVVWKSEYNETLHTLTFKISQNSTTVKFQENGSLSLIVREHFCI